MHEISSQKHRDMFKERGGCGKERFEWEIKIPVSYFFIEHLVPVGKLLEPS